MNNCYIGRGSLLVAEIGSSRGFFPLSGESELTLAFEEANESVRDARNGVIERTDWYERNRNAVLRAESFRIVPEAINLLLKANTTSTADAPVESIVASIPATIETGNSYYLGRPGGTGVLTLIQANAAPVPASQYSYNAKWGTIKILDKTGLVFPLQATAGFAATAMQAISTRNHIAVKALFTGYNRITGKEVFAEFYRLYVDIAESIALVQQPYTGMPVNLVLAPDFTNPADESPFGYYGRIYQS